MVKTWNRFLLSHCTDWGLPSTGDWNFWFYNNYHPHCVNLDLMWFHDADRFPRVATKLDRNPEILQREFDNLRQVYARAPEWVPKPLSFGRLDDFWALWMEGLPGSPLQIPPGHVAPILDRIAEMIASIHAAVRSEAPPSPARFRRMVTEPIRSVERFGESAAVVSGCARLAEMADRQWMASLPVIPQHGDLYPGNVILFQGRPHVLDWETFGAIDLPFYDLLTFLVALLGANGDPPERWDAAWAGQAPALIELYSSRLGLPPSDVEVLLPLTLVNWFHLLWLDGREKFAARMYRTIEHYFDHSDMWQRMFAAAPPVHV
jgi:aminoglycoside phosphotransferase (APT) family kinase protein